MSNLQQTKAKGIVDIVFLMDVTGSMQTCIDSLKENIASFIDFLTTKDANNSCPVKDWRAKAVGYRDYKYDKQPFVDHPFVRDPAVLRTQLSKLTADGGEDEPESALDAIYKVSTMGQTEKGANEDPFKWRYRSSAARVVILFTDASFHETMDLPEAVGGGIQDVFNVIMANRIVLNIFAPDMPCYNELSKVQKSEYEAISYDTADQFGAQKALAEYTRDRENFKQVLKALAASVSKSAEAETPAV
jgi:uncharacterized protein YegL